MPQRHPATPVDPDRSVLPWRLVAGGFAHFVLPAYLIALLAEFVIARPPTASAWLPQVLPFSGWFVLVYSLLALAGVIAAAVFDVPLRARRRRRAARAPVDEAQLSRRRLIAAVTEGRTGLGLEAKAVLHALETGRWDHDDPAFQALARDLEEVVRTSTAALRSAPAERRAAIAESTTTALRHLEAARRELEVEAALKDEQQQLTSARYVELRYGSDFASKPD